MRLTSRYPMFGGPADGLYATVPVERSSDTPPEWYHWQPALPPIPDPDPATMEVEVHVYRRKQRAEGSRRWWQYHYVPDHEAANAPETGEELPAQAG